MKVKKKIPKFKNEDAERNFWAKHDSSDYIDWTKAKYSLFPKLKPSLKTISIRLPETLLYSLKELANKKDIAYQSLIKIMLAEKVTEEFNIKK